MAAKKIPEWFPKEGEEVFYAIGDSQERGSFRVDNISREVAGYLVARMYGDTTTADLELCAVPIGGNLEFCGEWHLQDHSRCAMFALHPTALRVYRENGDEIVIPQAVDPYFERIRIIASQRTLLEQLGIPEDSELAGVELPDVGDEVVVSFVDEFSDKPNAKMILKTKVVGVGSEMSEELVICHLPCNLYERMVFAYRDGWRLKHQTNWVPAEVQIIRSKG